MKRWTVALWLPLFACAASADSSVDPGLERPVAVGDSFANLSLIDQFGDTVEMYDFVGQERPIVVQVSAMWSLSDHDVAKVLMGEPSKLSDHANVADMVGNGDVAWITVIEQDVAGAAPTEGTVADWYAEYPHPSIPVLASEEEDGLAEYLSLRAFPTMLLLESDGTVAVAYPDHFVAVFDELEARFGAQYP